MTPSRSKTTAWISGVGAATATLTDASLAPVRLARAREEILERRRDVAEVVESPLAAILERAGLVGQAFPRPARLGLELAGHRLRGLAHRARLGLRARERVARVALGLAALLLRVGVDRVADVVRSTRRPRRGCARPRAPRRRGSAPPPARPPRERSRSGRRTRRSRTCGRTAAEVSAKGREQESSTVARVAESNPLRPWQQLQRPRPIGSWFPWSLPRAARDPRRARDNRCRPGRARPGGEPVRALARSRRTCSPASSSGRTRPRRSRSCTRPR